MLLIFFWYTLFFFFSVLSIVSLSQKICLKSFPKTDTVMILKLLSCIYKARADLEPDHLLFQKIWAWKERNPTKIHLLHVLSLAGWLSLLAFSSLLLLGENNDARNKQWHLGHPTGC